MTRKNFDAAVHETAKSQGVVAQNQFDKAELILKNAQSALSGLTEKKGSSVERPIFSMPATDLALIDVMRSRAGKSGRISTSKSEIVRAGLHALAALEEPALLDALNRLHKVRRGN
jgi:hypothetical protein